MSASEMLKKIIINHFFIVVAFVASGCSEIGVTLEAACKMATSGIKNKKTKMVKD